jgi:cell division protein DivIC
VADRKKTIIYLGVILIAGIICINLVRSIAENLKQNNIITRQYQALETEKKHNRELKNQLREATGAAFVEKEARNKLGLVKPGETVVLLPHEESKGINAINTQDTTTDAISRWRKWWNLFF